MLESSILYVKLIIRNRSVSILVIIKKKYGKVRMQKL